MDTGLFAPLLVALSFLPAGGEPGEWFNPYALNAKVLDILENNQVLISIGKNEGARKGMEMEVYRLGPEPRYIGRVELVEVGAKHSLGRFRAGFAKPYEARENDLVSRFSPVMPATLNFPRLPVWQQRGGAIADPEELLKKK